MGVGTDWKPILAAIPEDSVGWSYQWGKVAGKSDFVQSGDTSIGKIAFIGLSLDRRRRRERPGESVRKSITVKSFNRHRGR